MKVVVVGGGPAGSVAAGTLARRGIETLLIDRAKFPRDKPCGGGIRYDIVRRFPWIAAILQQVPAAYVQTVRLESPGGHVVECEGDEPHYLLVRRCQFDAALLEWARSGGAAVQQGALATAVKFGESEAVVETSQGAFRCGMVIAADGVNSIVARSAGLLGVWPATSLAIDTMEETPLTELAPASGSTMYVFYGYGRYAGYGYVFPKAHHIDLGVGCLLSHFRDELHSPRPYDLHLAFIRDLQERGLVTGASRRENFKAYMLPMGGQVRPSFRDRALLAGDAGGFVNGYTAEGIYYAMVSGEHAALAAAEAARAGDYSAASLSRYETNWRREIGEELDSSLKIQKVLFRKPWMVDQLVRSAARYRPLRDLLARIAVGRAAARPNKWRLMRQLVRAQFV